MNEANVVNEPSSNEPLTRNPTANTTEPPQIVQAKLVQTAQPAIASTANHQGLYQQVLHSRLAILATLFCATGFLGLPLLWMNPHFTTLQRWGWAIVVTIYTCIVIALAGWVVVWSWNSVSESL